MIILIKTPTVTFSLDINLADRVSSLIEKVKERASLEPYQFQLAYAGSTMDIPDEPLSNFNIKKESTVHMNIIKLLTYDVEHNGTIYKLTVGNNPGVQIIHLRNQFKNELKKNDPNILTDKQIVFKQGNDVLDFNAPLQTTVDTKLVVMAELIDAPVYTSPTPGVQPEAVPEISSDEFTQHFIGSSLSNDVEIVFCFDTTGSMYSCLKQVRQNVHETVTRLVKEIPSIRIGIVGVGDFCDTLNVINTLDLTSNVNTLCKYIMNVPATGGGDEDEAYELALQRVKGMSWSKHTSKAIVMIGDSAPHAPYYSNLNVNWLHEVDDLESMGIKIYGVVCQHERHRYFYQTMAERTGGLCIQFARFNLITQMFLAICFRESSKEKYEEYKSQVADGDMGTIFRDLDKENFKVGRMYDDEDEKEKDKPEEKEKAEKEGEPSTSTTTTTATPPAAKVVIKKRYGVLNKIPDGVLETRLPECLKFMRMDDSEMAKNSIQFRHYLGVLSLGSSKFTTYRNPAIAMVLGSLHIGFNSFEKKLIKARLFKKGKIIFHDYRLDELSQLPNKSIFVAAYAHDSVESFESLRKKIDVARNLHKDVPIVLMGLKSDLKAKEGILRPSSRTRSKSMSTVTATVEEVTVEEVKPIITKLQRDMLIEEYSLAGEVNCSTKVKGSTVQAEKEVYKIFKRIRDKSTKEK